MAQTDSSHKAKISEKFANLLACITPAHVCLIIGLKDIYHELAKAEHGCSKVNQMPWEAYDRVSALEEKLNQLTSSDDWDLWKSLAQYKTSLLEGVIDDVPIVTETRRLLRSGSLAQANTLDTILNKSYEQLKKIAHQMVTELKNQITEPELITQIRKAFLHWDEEAVSELISVANSQGNLDYGKLDVLLEQYRTLKLTYQTTRWGTKSPETHKWLMITTCSCPYHYRGLEAIIHFALCCFIKAPIETIVESVGSVINKHVKKARSAMKPQTLADEVLVSWNGPSEHSSAAEAILHKALHNHFTESPITFYKNSKRSKIFATASSTVGKMLKTKSRIQFY